MPHWHAVVQVRVHNLVDGVVAVFMPPTDVDEAMTTVFSFADVYHLCVVLILFAFSLVALVVLR